MLPGHPLFSLVEIKTIFTKVGMRRKAFSRSIAAQVRAEKVT